MSAAAKNGKPHRLPSPRRRRDDDDPVITAAPVESLEDGPLDDSLEEPLEQQPIQATDGPLEDAPPRPPSKPRRREDDFDYEQEIGKRGGTLPAHQASPPPLTPLPMPPTVGQTARAGGRQPPLEALRQPALTHEQKDLMLALILRNPGLMRYASSALKPGHFHELERELRLVWEVMLSHYMKTGVPIPRQTCYADLRARIESADLVRSQVERLDKLLQRAYRFSADDVQQNVPSAQAYLKRFLHEAIQHKVRALITEDDSLEKLPDVLTELAAEAGRAGGNTEIERYRDSMGLITLGELAELKLQHDWAIEDFLVMGEPCLVYGPSKIFKTTILCNIAVSIATGTPFLGRWQVPRKRKIVMLSGESGRTNLQNIFRACCAMYGVWFDRSLVDWVTLGTRVPRLGDTVQELVLREILADRKPEILIIDPAYFMMSGVAKDLYNQSLMGGHLERLADIGRDHNCTILLAAHTTKSAGNAYEPLGLTAINGSGYDAWMAQWIGISRRCEYRPGSRQHRLWCTYGGRADHEGLVGLDLEQPIVRKGNTHLAEDGSGYLPELRGLEITVREAEECRGEAAAVKEQGRQQERSEADDRHLEDLVERLLDGQWPQGATKEGIRAALQIGKTAAQRVIDAGLAKKLLIQRQGSRQGSWLYQLADQDEMPASEGKPPAAKPASEGKPPARRSRR